METEEHLSGRWADEFFWQVCEKEVIIQKFRYLPSAVFIALMLVGPSKYLKQTIQNELNRVKNPNWVEANQLAIYKPVAEDLNSGLPWTNPASSQKGTWTRGLRFASPVL